MTMIDISPPPPPKLRLPGVFMRRTGWNGADLTKADLSGADASYAQFVDVDFEQARLNGTILRGADLSGARNLTHEQLATAVIDEATKLPTYIERDRLAQLGSC